MRGRETGLAYLDKKEGEVNTETGEVKLFPGNLKLKLPWIPVNAPNPSCRRCKGKGSVLDGNRAARRHNLTPMHYMPCPDCAGKK